MQSPPRERIIVGNLFVQPPICCVERTPIGQTRKINQMQNGSQNARFPSTGVVRSPCSWTTAPDNACAPTPSQARKVLNAMKQNKLQTVMTSRSFRPVAVCASAEF
jgi:hypothetical protein